jgi:Dolichyl-phosphate-mannose-protein mannosyltransferase
VKPRPGSPFGLVLAAVIAAIAAPSLFRAGYTPDEEFTLFAVRGIHAHGLPLLPSGLLYDRGLLYSYLSWLAATLTGVELPAFRALSLVSAASALALGYVLVRRLVSRPAGTVAALLVAASLPFWAAATTGRFYAPFLLTCVGVLVLVARLVETEETESRVGLLCGLAAMTFVSRLTHELAFTLLAIPVASLIVSWCGARATPRGQNARHFDSRHLRLVSAAAAGLVAAQALLMALHFVTAGSGGSTMIERFFLWQVLNLFERPHGAPLGVVLAAVVVAWLLVPARAAASLVLGLGAALVAMVIALAYASFTGPLSTSLVQNVVASSLAYPLDMFWSLAGTHPLMVLTAIALLVARLCGAGGEWPAAERAAHLGWVGWVVWFGIIESGTTINYVLLPTVCMLAAIGIDLVAVGQQSAAVWPGRRGQAARALLSGVALAVAADQWPGTGSIPQRLAAARPAIDVAGIDGIRAELRPMDLVACTDELACLLLVGRVDAWLALDDYVRERFLVIRARQDVGVYTGAPAVFRLADLFKARPDGHSPGRVIVVDVFKDYPVGNSRAWLPRALAADHLDSRDLLLTSQARVVELERGTRN